MPHYAHLLAASPSNTWASAGPRIVGLVIAGLVLVWIGVFLLEWISRRKSRSIIRQSTLFDQLCQTHGLSIDAQRLLTEVAKQHARGDAVLPFVDPRILETTAATSPELAAIGRQLFGTAWQGPAAL